MQVAVSKRLYNVDEYHKMAEAGILKPSDRVELINGEIIEMSPIGSKHASVVNRLARVLNEKLFGKATISIQNLVQLDNENELEPDISILKFQKDDYENSLPTASDVFTLMEVSDSTYEKDRWVKSTIYANHGIKEYWIIDLNSMQIECFQSPFENQYRKLEIFTKGQDIPLLDSFINVDQILGK